MRAKTWRAWTSRERQALAEMRGDGMTVREIAAELGRTVEAVRQRLVEERCPSARSVLLHRWLPALRAPHRLRELAARFGVSYRAAVMAKQRLRRLGYQVPPAVRQGGRREGRA